MLSHPVSGLLASTFHVKAAATVLREANKVDLLQMGLAFKFKRFGELDMNARLSISFLTLWIN